MYNVRERNTTFYVLINASVVEEFNIHTKYEL